MSTTIIRESSPSKPSSEAVIFSFDEQTLDYTAGRSELLARELPWGFSLELPTENAFRSRGLVELTATYSLFLLATRSDSTGKDAHFGRPSLLLGLTRDSQVHMIVHTPWKRWKRSGSGISDQDLRQQSEIFAETWTAYVNQEAASNASKELFTSLNQWDIAGSWNIWRNRIFGERADTYKAEMINRGVAFPHQLDRGDVPSAHQVDDWTQWVSRS